jgi:hypothetical protein
MKSILDPTFKYTPAVQTDIAATFRRIRREADKQAKENAEREALDKENTARVVAIYDKRRKS